jgi:inhibitor of cysteine peptidase
MKKIACLALLLLSVASLAASAETIPINTRLYNKFSIDLASNPTTGYGWRLGGKLNGELIKPLGSQFIPPQTQLVGAGGREIWRFQAVGRGRTKIVLEYARPWEKNIKPADRRVYEVLIK